MIVFFSVTLAFSGDCQKTVLSAFEALDRGNGFALMRRLISDFWFLVKRLANLACLGFGFGSGCGCGFGFSSGIVINCANALARQAAIILNAKIMPPTSTWNWDYRGMRFASDALHLTRFILPHRLRRHLIKISFSWYDGRGEKFPSFW